MERFVDFEYDANYDSYSAVMRRADLLIGINARKVQLGGQGVMLPLISSGRDRIEEDLLVKKFAQGIEVDNPTHIDAGRIASAIEFNIDRDRLGISKSHLEDQTVEQSFYEYVFRGFGKAGEGFRIGHAAISDRFLRNLSTIRLIDSGIASFITSLEIELPDSSIDRKLVVLHFPEMDQLMGGESLNLSEMPVEKADRVRKNLALCKITSLAGTLIYNDNPRGHSVVSIVDGAYRWFAARNTDFIAVSESFSNAIETPSAREADLKRMTSI